jgi:hypothetical protein
MSQTDFKIIIFDVQLTDVFQLGGFVRKSDGFEEFHSVI